MTKLDLGNVRGNIWTTGTAITHDDEHPETPVAGAAGHVGDMYLNTETGNVYQCTASGDGTTAEWTFKGCLKSGIPGAPGADGSTILHGSESPDAGVGNDGDYYLNTDTGALYVKNDGVWESIITLSTDGIAIDNNIAETDNPVRNRAIFAALAGKVDKPLTSTPTQNSQSPFTAGGAYVLQQAISALQNNPRVMGTTKQVHVIMGNSDSSKPDYKGKYTAGNRICRRVGGLGGTVFLTIGNNGGAWKRDSRTGFYTNTVKNLKCAVLGRIPRGYAPRMRQYSWVQLETTSKGTLFGGCWLYPNNHSEEALRGRIVLASVLWNSSMNIVKSVADSTGALVYKELFVTTCYEGETGPWPDGGEEEDGG